MSLKIVATIAMLSFGLTAVQAYAAEGAGDPFPFSAPGVPSDGHPFVANTGSEQFPQLTGEVNQPESLAVMEPSYGSEAPVETASSLPKNFANGTPEFFQARIQQRYLDPPCPDPGGQPLRPTCPARFRRPPKRMAFWIEDQAEALITRLFCQPAAVLRYTQDVTTQKSWMLEQFDPRPLTRRPFIPPMPPLAPDGVGGLRVLFALQRNGMAAFPRPLPARNRDKAAHARPAPSCWLAEGRRCVHVMHSHADDYQRLPAGRRILGPIVGRGLLVSEGETWRRQRRVMAPAFTPRTVPVMAEHILRCAETSCARLDALPDGPVDLLTELQALSLDIAASSMFSLETGNFGGEIRAMVSRYMATVGRAPRQATSCCRPACRRR